MDKVPETREELLELIYQWEYAYGIYESTKNWMHKRQAWTTIGDCEALFDKCECWIDEDGIFVKEEK